MVELFLFKHSFSKEDLQSTEVLELRYFQQSCRRENVQLTKEG